MVYKPQISDRKSAKMLESLQVQLRKGEDAATLPCVNVVLDPWGPQQIWLSWASGGFLCRWVVHVIASAIVFGAIFANLRLVIDFSDPMAV